MTHIISQNHPCFSEKTSAGIRQSILDIPNKLFSTAKEGNKLKISSYMSQSHFITKEIWSLMEFYISDDFKTNLLAQIKSPANPDFQKYSKIHTILDIDKILDINLSSISDNERP